MMIRLAKAIRGRNRMTQIAPRIVASAVRPLRRLAYVAAIIATLLATHAMVRPVSAAGDCTVSSTDTTPDAEEQALLTAINTYRQQNGLAALASSGALNRSAAWLSKDMATRRSLNRTDSLGRDHLTRMKDCGASFTAAEENVASGAADAASTLQTWKASTSQNMVILSSNFRAAGVARYADPALPSQTYWTLDLSDTVDSGSGSTGTTSTGTTSTSTQSGMGTVSVSVSLRGATGQTTRGSLSGFQFVLRGSAGGAYTTPPTNEQGQTSLALPAGTYTVTQQPKAGATVVSISGGTGAGTTATGTAATGSTATSGTATNGAVTVAAGMTASVMVVDQVGGTSQTTTSAATSLTNPATNPLTNPFLNPTTNPLSNPFPNNPFANNPFANPAINPASNTVPTMPAAGATTATTSAATTSTTTEMVTLVTGCNNVSITWAAGTPVSTVAAAVTGGLDAIWRWDSARNMYLGYSAIPGAPADYTTVEAKFEPAFICVKAAGSIARPAG
jgi:uncharacterized protein YkwD